MIKDEIRALLPKEMQLMMETLNAQFGAPDELTLPCVLATANFAAQAVANVNPGYTSSCPLSLNLIVLSASGTLKSTVSNECMRAITEYQEDLASDFASDKQQYKIDKARYDKALKAYIDQEQTDKAPAKPTPHQSRKTVFDDVTEGRSPVEPVSEAIDLPVEPESPVSNIHVVQKSTVNGLIDVLRNVGFAGLFSADAGEFFNSHAFQDKSRSTEMVSMLSKLFSGETIDRTTGIADNNVQLVRRRFNMLFLLQSELASFLLDPTNNAQGFVPRLLVTQPEEFKTPRFDFSPEGVARKQEYVHLARLFHGRIRSILDSVRPAQSKSLADVRAQNPDRTYSNKVLILPTLEFDDPARLLMQDFGNQMMDANESKLYRNHVPFIARAYENACRIAGTLAVFERLDTIGVRQAECAIGLMEYFIEQRMSMLVEREAPASPVASIAQDLIEWVDGRLLKDPDFELTKTSLAQYGPKTFRQADLPKREHVLTEVLDREWMTVELLTTGTKPKTVYKRLQQ